MSKLYNERILQKILEDKPNAKLFISGAISSRLDTYKEVFDESEGYLRELGFKNIYNPAVIDINTSWEEAMRQTLEELRSSEVVYVLRDYEISEGVKQELEVAEVLELPIIYQEERV